MTPQGKLGISEATKEGMWNESTIFVCLFFQSISFTHIGSVFGKQAYKRDNVNPMKIGL